MGYSYTAAAGKTEELWSQACRAQTGSQNTFYPRVSRDGTINTDGPAYFYERGRENDDGAITGSVYKFTGSSNSIVTGTARKVGTYKINPDGTVERAPAFLKAASAARDKYIRETPGAREEALRTGG